MKTPLPTSLEDEFGDIFRKAQRGQKIPDEEITRRFGLTKEQIRDIYGYRLIPDMGTVEAMAVFLGLKSDALVASAAKIYRPDSPPVEHWGCLAMVPSRYEDMTVNSYIVWDKDTREAVLFDTGTDFEAIREILEAFQLNLRFVALTHTHADHIAVLDDVLEHTSPELITSHREPIASARKVREGDTLKLGSLSIQVRDTSGHSVGGLTYLIRGFTGSPDVAVVGDALFAGSAGGAMVDYQSLITKIRTRILRLPERTLILSGHGPLTTVGQERVFNPFSSAEDST